MSATKLPDGDYILEDGAAWIEVKCFAVRLYHDGMGLRVSVCTNGQEYDTIKDMYVLDSDVEG